MVIVEVKDAQMVKHSPLKDHAESYLPKEKKWKLVWNDEFDGDKLDESKWNFRRNYWGKKSPTFTDEGVTVEDSNLHIALIKKDDNYYSAHLQTGSLTFDIPKDKEGIWPFGQYQPLKFMHKYGYYEIRCKLPKNDGWHAAFWLQAPGIGSHPDTKYAGVEVDVMENYKQHTLGRIMCGNGYDGYGKDSKWPGHFEFQYEETDDGWHYYGVDWSKDGYTFYADGNFVGRQAPPECPVSEVEQFILVSTECHGYHRNFGQDGDYAGMADTWAGKPVPELHEAVLPDEFIVDFVRVYDQIEE